MNISIDSKSLINLLNLEGELYDKGTRIIELENDIRDLNVSHRDAISDLYRQLEDEKSVRQHICGLTPQTNKLSVADAETFLSFCDPEKVRANKIMTIKCIKVSTGLGLKQAKDFVEAWLDKQSRDINGNPY